MLYLHNPLIYTYPHSHRNTHMYITYILPTILYYYPVLYEYPPSSLCSRSPTAATTVSGSMTCSGPLDPSATSSLLSALEVCVYALHMI